jgi:hypothetical protein
MRPSGKWNPESIAKERHAIQIVDTRKMRQSLIDEWITRELPLFNRTLVKSEYAQHAPRRAIRHSAGHLRTSHSEGKPVAIFAKLKNLAFKSLLKLRAPSFRVLCERLVWNDTIFLPDQ